MFSASKVSSVLRSTVNGKRKAIYTRVCANRENYLVARRTYANNGGYESTYKNLLINKDTKVICQGFTGKQVSLKKCDN